MTATGWITCRSTRRATVLFVALGLAAWSGAARSEQATEAADAGAGAQGAADSGTAEVSPSPPTPILRITGTAVLPDSVARTAIGVLPHPGDEVDRWGEQAVLRIADAYRARGYLYARAWFSDTKQPGVLWFDLDEGHVRVSFVGMSSITATLFRLRLNLPGGVFQKDDVERSLEEQRKALKLANVYYRVHELESYDVTVFGEIVPARTLEIHVVRRESFGWALDISVSAAWGVVPSVKYSESDLVWHDDRLLVELDLAIPYRRYVFDESPRTTWVHGGVSGSYRLPHFGHRTLAFFGLAPRVDMSVSLSQYARSDLQLKSFYLLRDQTVANLTSAWPEVEISLGFGADTARVFLASAAASPDGQPRELPLDVYSARFLTRAAFKWSSALPWTRRDRRTFANVTVDLCLPAEVRATLWMQYFAVSGRHRLFIRGRAVELAGAVPYWDDVELAGGYQRVFFGDVYWAHEAAQLELAYQMRLWRDWFEIGVFHDVTAFSDRLPSPPVPRLMDAFGPSLHFLILDQYALSVHQAIGFAPGRFSQTLSFTVESTF